MVVGIATQRKKDTWNCTGQIRTILILVVRSNQLPTGYVTGIERMHYAGDDTASRQRFCLKKERAGGA
jgi:hypothetical protein